MAGRRSVALLAAAVVALAGASATLPPCYMGDTGKVVIGQKAYLCITINGRSRLMVNPVADEFSAVRINNSEKRPGEKRFGQHGAPRGR